MKRWITAALAALCCATASAQTKCEANLHGFKIGTVYIVGRQYNAVVWAYKHLAESTCLTPTLNPAKADAILDLEPAASSRDNASVADSLLVTCSSSGGASSCIDSAGNEMDTVCDGGGNCVSGYGPSLTSGVGSLVHAWIESSWFAANAFLYTTDRKLLWTSSEQKGGWIGDRWPDLVRLGTGSPECKVSAWERSRFRNYRHWASTKCGVEFAPLVRIDIQIEAKRDADAMSSLELRNAEDAARKQKSQ